MPSLHPDIFDEANLRGTQHMLDEMAKVCDQLNALGLHIHSVSIDTQRGRGTLEITIPARRDGAAEAG